MPVYDYRCEVCNHRFAISYPSIAAYEAATPQCPQCHSADLARIIRRVQMLRSEDSRMDALENMGELDALADPENMDPRALGSMMRKMSREMGEDMGPEFDEVVGRLEAGESPESIEENLGDTLDDSTI